MDRKAARSTGAFPLWNKPTPFSPLSVHLYFLLPNSKSPDETFNQGAMAAAACPRLTPEHVSKAHFSLTLQ